MNLKIRIVHEGLYLLVLPIAILIILLFNLPDYYFSLFKCIFFPIFLGLNLFFLFFFRDFRRTPDISDAIISPADGSIFKIDERDDYYSFYIRLRMRNVHTQKAPISGRVIFVKRVKGRRHKIYFFVKSKNRFNKARLKNSRAIIRIQGESGDIVEVIQICGIWARRARPCVELNQLLELGVRLGIIMFGSLVKFTIQKKDYKLMVKVGDKVKGGKSVLLL